MNSPISLIHTKYTISYLEKQLLRLKSQTGISSETIKAMTFKIATMSLNLALDNFSLGNYEKAEIFLLKSQNLTDPINNQLNFKNSPLWQILRIKVLLNLGLVYIKLKKYLIAHQILKNLEENLQVNKVSSIYETEIIVDIIDILFQNLSKLAYKINLFDESLTICEKSISFTYNCLENNEIKTILDNYLKEKELNKDEFLLKKQVFLHKMLYLQSKILKKIDQNIQSNIILQRGYKSAEQNLGILHPITIKFAQKLHNKPSIPLLRNQNSLNISEIGSPEGKKTTFIRQFLIKNPVIQSPRYGITPKSDQKNFGLKLFQLKDEKSPKKTNKMTIKIENSSKLTKIKENNNEEFYNKLFVPSSGSFKDLELTGKTTFTTQNSSKKLEKDKLFLFSNRRKKSFQTKNSISTKAILSSRRISLNDNRFDSLKKLDFLEEKNDFLNLLITPRPNTAKLQIKSQIKEKITKNDVLMTKNRLKTPKSSLSSLKSPRISKKPSTNELKIPVSTHFKLPNEQKSFRNIEISTFLAIPKSEDQPYIKKTTLTEEEAIIKIQNFFRSRKNIKTRENYKRNEERSMSISIGSNKLMYESKKRYSLMNFNIQKIEKTENNLLLLTESKENISDFNSLETIDENDVEFFDFINFNIFIKNFNLQFLNWKFNFERKLTQFYFIIYLCPNVFTIQFDVNKQVFVEKNEKKCVWKVLNSIYEAFFLENKIKFIEENENFWSIIKNNKKLIENELIEYDLFIRKFKFIWNKLVFLVKKMTGNSYKFSLEISKTMKKKQIIQISKYFLIERKRIIKDSICEINESNYRKIPQNKSFLTHSISLKTRFSPKSSPKSKQKPLDLSLKPKKMKRICSFQHLNEKPTIFSISESPFSGISSPRKKKSLATFMETIRKTEDFDKKQSSLQEIDENDDKQSIMIKKDEVSNEYLAIESAIRIMENDHSFKIPKENTNIRKSNSNSEILLKKEKNLFLLKNKNFSKTTKFKNLMNNSINKKNIKIFKEVKKEKNFLIYKFINSLDFNELIGRFFMKTEGCFFLAGIFISFNSELENKIIDFVKFIDKELIIKTMKEFYFIIKLFGKSEKYRLFDEIIIDFNEFNLLFLNNYLLKPENFLKFISYTRKIPSKLLINFVTLFNKNFIIKDCKIIKSIENIKKIKEKTIIKNQFIENKEEKPIENNLIFHSFGIEKLQYYNTILITNKKIIYKEFNINQSKIAFKAKIFNNYVSIIFYQPLHKSIEYLNIEPLIAREKFINFLQISNQKLQNSLFSFIFAVKNCQNGKKLKISEDFHEFFSKNLDLSVFSTDLISRDLNFWKEKFLTITYIKNLKLDKLGRVFIKLSIYNPKELYINLFENNKFYKIEIQQSKTKIHKFIMNSQDIEHFLNISFYELNDEKILSELNSSIFSKFTYIKCFLYKKLILPYNKFSKNNSKRFSHLKIEFKKKENPLKFIDFNIRNSIFFDNKINLKANASILISEFNEFNDNLYIPSNSIKLINNFINEENSFSEKNSSIKEIEKLNFKNPLFKFPIEKSLKIIDKFKNNESLQNSSLKNSLLENIYSKKNSYIYSKKSSIKKSQTMKNKKVDSIITNKNSIEKKIDFIKKESINSQNNIKEIEIQKENQIIENGYTNFMISQILIHEYIFQNIVKVNGEFAIATVRKHNILKYWNISLYFPKTNRSFICSIHFSDILKMSPNFFESIFTVSLQELFEKIHLNIPLTYKKFTDIYNSLISDHTNIDFKQMFAHKNLRFIELKFWEILLKNSKIYLGGSKINMTQRRNKLQLQVDNYITNLQEILYEKVLQKSEEDLNFLQIYFEDNITRNIIQESIRFQLRNSKHFTIVIAIQNLNRNVDSNDKFALNEIVNSFIIEKNIDFDPKFILHSTLIHICQFLCLKLKNIKKSVTINNYDEKIKRNSVFFKNNLQTSGINVFKTEKKLKLNCKISLQSLFFNNHRKGLIIFRSFLTVSPRQIIAVFYFPKKMKIGVLVHNCKNGNYLRKNFSIEKLTHYVPFLRQMLVLQEFNQIGERITKNLKEMLLVKSFFGLIK